MCMNNAVINSPLLFVEDIKKFLNSDELSMIIEWKHSDVDFERQKKKNMIEKTVQNEPIFDKMLIIK